MFFLLSEIETYKRNLSLNNNVKLLVKNNDFSDINKQKTTLFSTVNNDLITNFLISVLV